LFGLFLCDTYKEITDYLLDTCVNDYTVPFQTISTPFVQDVELICTDDSNRRIIVCGLISKDLPTLIHEISHVLDRLGSIINEDITGEIRAYYMEYLFSEVVDWFNTKDKC